MPKLVDDPLVQSFCECCDKYCKIDGACGVLLYEKQRESV